MIDRRDVVAYLGALAATVTLSPCAAHAQHGTRRIGVLTAVAADDAEGQLRAKALEAALRELGWVEGRNLRIDYRWAGSSEAEVLRKEAAALVQTAPDLIVTTATPVTLALKAQGGTIPTVFVQVTDPVGQGLVSSLARPGGNFTGFTTFEFAIGTKWLETLKIMAPQVARVALLYNPHTAPFADLFRSPVETAAPAFDVTLTPVPFRNAGEIERALATFAATPNGALMVLPDASTTNQRDLIVTLAARHRLPAIYPFRYFATSGGLVSYGVDVTDSFHRAAGYIDRILRGAKPADLPVQSPSKYELVINVKTAKALDLALPPLLLSRADEVIE
jgi:putative tryptophan/tyrosine transport system substrate-binding protein